jgi:hypothetical protein
MTEDDARLFWLALSSLRDALFGIDPFASKGGKSRRIIDEEIAPR